jgi:hypothetical protein
MLINAEQMEALESPERPVIAPCDQRVEIKPHEYHEMFEPKSYKQLLAKLTKLAEDQSPAQDGETIATAIAAHVTFPGTNNKATWPDSWREDDSLAKKCAKAIDEDEAERLAAAKKFDEDADWQLDCGIMASLVKQHQAGNCDDLASYALDYGMKNFSDCVLCFVQDRGFDHSFLLVYCKGEKQVWLVDSWVSQDRVIPFEKSIWFKDLEISAFMPVKVSTSNTGVIEAWDAHAADRPRKRRRASDETPRLEQVGQYIHPSARAQESS